MNNIFLAGKDAPLNQTIDNVSRILYRIDLELQEAAWFNPTPDCWSVHLQATSCPQLCTNGKGSSHAACMASGLGEFVERLATNFFFADYFLEEIGPGSPFCYYPDEVWFQPTSSENVFSSEQRNIQLLTAELREFYDPERELRHSDLTDNNSSPNHSGICALPFYQLDTEQKVYFPVSILNNLYVSNGMAAGNTRAEGTAQALSEIIERHVKKIIIQRGLALPDIPQIHIDQFPKICAVQSALSKRGFTVRIKDGSLGGAYPVICVLLTDLAKGGVYAAFGASLRFETAIERTVTELLQGRNLEQLGNFMLPSHNLAEVADDMNLESHFINSEGLLSWRMFRDKPDYQFTPWDFKGSTEEEVKLLQLIISTKGFSIFRAEYLHYSLYTCRIIIPGMSEIYPVDELIYNNCNKGTSIRDQLLKLPTLSKDGLVHFIDTLDSLAVTDQQLISQLIGVIFPEQSAWHSLRLGELKALVFLALGNGGEALFWCDWCVEYGLLPQKRTRLYRLLHDLLCFEEKEEGYEDYKENIHLFYNEQELEKARKILSQQENFPDLKFADSWASVSPDHMNLLEIYTNQKKFKSIFLK